MRYYEEVSILPGQSEAYTLPEGCDSCPVESCPAYGRPLVPPWRVNEHMKQRHGWPRKVTQPTDGRLSGARKRPRQITWTEDASVPSPKRVAVAQKDTPATDLLNDDTPALSSNRIAVALENSRATIVPAKDFEPVPSCDNQLEDILSGYVSSLKADLAASTSLAHDSDAAAKATKEIVEQCEVLLASRNVRLNAVISADESAALLKVYQLAAQFENGRSAENTTMPTATATATPSIQTPPRGASAIGRHL